MHCPSCRKDAPPRAENRFFPFCSERCKLVDLGKWLGEQYRVPARPGESEGGATPEKSDGGEESG